MFEKEGGHDSAGASYCFVSKVDGACGGEVVDAVVVDDFEDACFFDVLYGLAEFVMID